VWDAATLGAKGRIVKLVSGIVEITATSPACAVGCYDSSQAKPLTPVENLAHLCGRRSLDNSLSERIVVPLSRTYDSPPLEGSPTEARRFVSQIDSSPFFL
jgi:hypothetical protein